MEKETREKIAALNDAFRSSFKGGQLVITRGIQALGNLDFILDKVRTYTDFHEGIDPTGLHEMGAFEVNGEKVWWKIDYYDLDCKWGSPDPGDPDVTTRVLTILLADER